VPLTLRYGLNPGLELRRQIRILGLIAGKVAPKSLDVLIVSKCDLSQCLEVMDVVEALSEHGVQSRVGDTLVIITLLGGAGARGRYRHDKGSKKYKKKKLGYASPVG
jgi:hypothetical protein